MRKTIVALILCAVIAAFFSPEAVKADLTFSNSDSGYTAVIEDSADLLSEADEQGIKELMEELTRYCNVGLVTTDDNPCYNTQQFAERRNDELFRGSSAVLFMIDMDERYIYLDSIGAARNRITSAYADSITDNVYTYARKTDYYSCAYEALDQVNTLMKGRMIAQPMKCISNALLAIALAMLINFIVVRVMSGKHKPSRNELISGIYSSFKINDAKATFTHQTKTYSPQSSGSSGSSGGGGSHSGGGGGGGHSGGGHSF